MITTQSQTFSSVHRRGRDRDGARAIPHFRIMMWGAQDVSQRWPDVIYSRYRSYRGFRSVSFRRGGCVRLGKRRTCA
jgi:hypothetical protein